MSQPAVTITEIDGALGAASPDGGKYLAVIGPSSTGPLNAPAPFGRVTPLVETFGDGPLVELAAHAIERYRKPVVAVRTGSSTAGGTGTVAKTGTGTSVPTLSGSPVDDFDASFVVVQGGTVGQAGITYRWSLDGGRTWSPVQALGTANAFAFPRAGLTLNLAAGTLVSGDRISTRTTAPAPSAAELGAALDALAITQAGWEIVTPASPIDGDGLDILDLKIAAMKAAGKDRMWLASARVATVGETPAQYLAALTAAFGSKATVHGGVCAGATKLVSSVSGRKYRRPVVHLAAPREAASSEEINQADVNLGSIVGASIRDVNGNPDEHDESIYPGLDDARFYVLRTHEGYPGVYVNRPRLFSPPGSDFQLVPHRRVLNLAHSALRSYFLTRLNKPVLVSKLTGYILEEEAQEIEAGALAIMRAVLLAKPKASDVAFVLSRTDNLLSTKTMNGDGRVIPLAYPEWINLAVGFSNPALQVQAV